MMMLASQAFLFRRLSLAVAPSFMTLSRDASGPLTRETPLPSETRDFDALLALLEPGVSPSLLPQPAQPPNLVPGGKEAIRSPSDPVPLVDSDAPPADPDPPADPSPSPATSAPFDAVADDGAVAGAEEGEEGDEEALAPDWSDLERGVWEEIMRRSGRHAAVLASCCRVLKAAFDWLVAKEDLTSSWPHISRETGLMRAPANFYAEVGPADDLQATIDGAPLDACIRLFKGRHVLKWQLYMPTVHLFGSKQGTTLVVDFAEGPVCNTWVFRGSCPRGATCSYTHTAVLPPQTCKYHYFLDAGCKHGDNCWFAESHSWPTCSMSSSPWDPAGPSWICTSISVRGSWVRRTLTWAVRGRRLLFPLRPQVRALCHCLFSLRARCARPLPSPVPDPETPGPKEIECCPGSRPRLQGLHVCASSAMYDDYGSDDDSDDDGRREVLRGPGLCASYAAPVIAKCFLHGRGSRLDSCGGTMEGCELMCSSRDAALHISGPGTVVAVRNTRIERGVSAALVIGDDVPPEWALIDPGQPIRFVYKRPGERVRALLARGGGTSSCLCCAAPA